MASAAVGGRSTVTPRQLLRPFYSLLGLRGRLLNSPPSDKLVHSKFIFNCGCRFGPAPPARSPPSDFCLAICSEGRIF